MDPSTQPVSLQGFLQTFYALSTPPQLLDDSRFNLPALGVPPAAVTVVDASQGCMGTRLAGTADAPIVALNCSALLWLEGAASGVRSSTGGGSIAVSLQVW
jgi:hypothetical protein